MINDAEILKTAALAIVPILLGVLAWFFRSAAIKQDKTINEALEIISELKIAQIHLQAEVNNLNKFTDSIATVTTDWAIIKHEVRQISKDLKELNELLDDVTLLKANQKYIFENIAEIRKELEGA